MINWGAKPNTNAEQWQSLGSVATGNVHTFSRYRTAADGASLHPLQRTGQVSAQSHAMMGGRMTAATPPGLGSAARAPAGYHNMMLPPIVPVGVGSSRDPMMRV